MEFLVDLTRNVMHEYLKGNPEPWFDLLCSKSIFIATAEDMLIGKKNIKQQLAIFAKQEKGKLIHDDYYLSPINAKNAIVIAHIDTESRSNKNLHITSTFSFIYQIKAKKPQMIFQHVSYEYFKSDQNKNYPVDLDTFRFIKHLLVDTKEKRRISIPIGNQMLYLDPKTIIYIQSIGHNCEIHCIDKILTCTKSITFLKEELPLHFYQVHRSYIINAQYLTAIYRYNVEMISGTQIPIPSRNYKQVKEDLKALVDREL